MLSVSSPPSPPASPAVDAQPARQFERLGHALDQRGIPDQALIDALAAVVWVTWAVLVASIAVEVPAALAGRRAPRLPLAGIFQPVTGRLVEATHDGADAVRGQR